MRDADDYEANEPGPPVCEHCGDDYATLQLWLCMDCVESLQ
jgi:hypothetical protein